MENVTIDYSMSLSEWDEGFKTIFNGIIRANYPVDSKKNTDIGRIRVSIIDFGRACNEHLNFFDLLDQDPDDSAFIELLENSSDFKESLLEKFDGQLIWRLLIIDRLEIFPEFRGNALGSKALDITIDILGYNCELAALYVRPLQFLDKDDEDRAVRFKHLSNNEEIATQKLSNFYMKSGFELFESQNLMIRVNPG